MKRALFLALVIITIIGCWRLHRSGQETPVTKANILTAPISRGSLVVTLPVSGALESAEEVPVRSEIAGTLLQICEDNQPIKAGDFVYQLDTKDLFDQRETLGRDLVDAQEAVESTKADSLTRVTQAQSDAKTAQEALKLAQEKAKAECEKIAAQVKFAEGEVARAERELNRTQRLAKLNYIPGAKLRDTVKAYNQKQFNLEQVRTQESDIKKRTAEQVKDTQTAYELSQHALETAEANAVDHLGDAQIRAAEAQRKLDDVDRKIKQCRVLAPAAGLVVIETNEDNWPERRPYRLGDMVQTSAAPVRIYDFKRMQVRCQIGEMDISRVHQGQEAVVSSSSREGKRYRAKVTMVEQLAQEANVWRGGTPGKKVFSAVISLSESDPAHLRPGMTVDLEIILGNVREATMAPIQAIFKEDGKSIVYRARGGSFERVLVKVGSRNDLLVEVQGNLQPGDRVALVQPPAQAVLQAGVRK